MSKRFTLLVLCSCCAWTHATIASDISIAPPIKGSYYEPFPERYNINQNDATLPRSIDFSTKLHIRINGPIYRGDEKKLQGALSNLAKFPQAIVSLNSTGGDFETALQMSDMIKAAAVSTFVGPFDKCLSSCAIVFLGGRVELIRNIYFRPSRFLHAGGLLGFHSPFVDADVGAPAADAHTLQFVADLWFDFARNAIRELESRIEEWGISPMLVFDFLGKGKTEFYNIDTYEKAQTNGIELLTDSVEYPKTLGFTEALSTCALVISTNLAQVYNNHHNIRAFVDLPQDLGDSNAFKYVTIDDLAKTIRTSNNMQTFTFQGLVSGRGPFECSVAPGHDGRWIARSKGDFPQIDNGYGRSFRIDSDGYVPNSYTILGPTVSWRRASQGGSLFGDITEDSVTNHQTNQPNPASFDCSNAHDPTSEVICAYSETRDADAEMGAQFKDLKRSPDIVERQRDWLHLRDRLCNITRASTDDPNQKILKGYCLYIMTKLRSLELKAR